MEMKTNTKIRVRLESFNHELLVSSCQKIIDTLNNASLNSIGMVTLPTSKRIYCVLRSPHVDKDSREHFEIRIHKRIIDIGKPNWNHLAKVISYPKVSSTTPANTRLGGVPIKVATPPIDAL